MTHLEVVIGLILLCLWSIPIAVVGAFFGAAIGAWIGPWGKIGRFLWIGSLFLCPLSLVAATIAFFWR
jgi:hypothetical protein